MFCLKERFYLNIFKLKKSISQKIINIFFNQTHTNISLPFAGAASFCCCFPASQLCKMIQQNKKLIESQTKKLFIISLCCFFFGGNFFHLSMLENTFCPFRGWVYFEPVKKITKNIALKTLLMNFNLKIRVFNNSAILLFLVQHRALAMSDTN